MCAYTRYTASASACTHMHICMRPNTHIHARPPMRKYIKNLKENLGLPEGEPPRRLPGAQKPK